MFSSKIKKAFEKIRENILFLSQELLELKQEVQELKQKIDSNRYPADTQHPTDNSARKLPNYGLIRPNFHSSIGNRGVPTDSQQITNSQFSTQAATPARIFDSSEIISTLGSLKQELKEKFKKLTKQEFLIFSVLYTLEEELKAVTYRDIAQRTGLAESSIRDYISRIERKGLPIIKERINNRVVVIKIPRELKEITSLSATFNSVNKFD